jgi:hypothetical protein
MRLYLILFLLGGCYFSGYSQRLCGSEEYAKHYFKPKQIDSNSEARVPPRDTSVDEIITIPVVVHVLFNNAGQNISDAQVLSQIAVLNEDFRKLNADREAVPEVFKSRAADARIMFCLAQVDPEGRPTTGILRRYTSKTSFATDDMKLKSKGGSDAWDSEQYLNIWVCSISGRTLGYATFPGGEATKDGVVIHYNVFGSEGNTRTGFDKGRTTTHEIAHWLGLKHIWGDADCGSDDIEDTPPQSWYNYNCPDFPRKSFCSVDNNGDMFMNFMDLTSDACMKLFTLGQTRMMRGQFALGAGRNSFLRSYRCDGSLASGAPLPQDTLPVVKKADKINIYPNPVSDWLLIEAKELATLQNQTALLYSVDGKLLEKFTLASNHEKIWLGKLAPGIYLLTIGEGAAKKTFKVIKV